MMIEKNGIALLFVCTGNICRSPTAEGVFRTLLEGISCKSESTSNRQARIITEIRPAARDGSRAPAHLEGMCPPGHRHKLRLFVPGREVPDPYHGGAQHFEEALDLIEAAAKALLEELRAHLSRVST